MENTKIKQTLMILWISQPKSLFQTVSFWENSEFLRNNSLLTYHETRKLKWISKNRHKWNLMEHKRCHFVEKIFMSILSYFIYFLSTTSIDICIPIFPFVPPLITCFRNIRGVDKRKPYTNVYILSTIVI